MKQIAYVFLLLCTVFTVACQDNAEGPTVAAPVLEPRGVPQDDLVSLAAIVKDDQISGTVHYLYFKESKHTGKPSPQELMEHRLTEKVTMNGATIKKFNFPAFGKTKYYIYAVLQLEDEISDVTTLVVETI